MAEELGDNDYHAQTTGNVVAIGEERGLEFQVFYAFAYGWQILFTEVVMA